MAIKTFFGHTTIGAASGHRGMTGNNPTIQSAVTLNSNPFAWLQDCVAGNDLTYMRLAGHNNTTGLTTASLDLADCPFSFNMRFDSFPNHEEIMVFVGDQGDAIGALHVKSDGKLYLHDGTKVASATASASSATAMVAGQSYVIQPRINVTTGAFGLRLYNSSGTLIDSVNATGLTFTGGGSTMVGNCYVGWQLGTVTGLFSSYTGDAGATFKRYVGDAYVDDSDYPNPALRTGILWPTGNGTYTGMTENTGTRLGAVTSENGDTAYLRSTTSGEAATFTVQSFAAAGISASSILAFSPGIVCWDEGGAPLIAPRFRWNGSNADLTQGDPGPTASFHRRAAIYTTMPQDGSGITQAKLEASEVGAVRNASTVAVRLGATFINVVYVPAASSGPDLTLGGAASCASSCR